MAESQPIAPQDDFLNVFLTAFLGVGVVIRIQSEDDAAQGSTTDDSGQ